MKERLKTVLIVLLCLSALFLLGRTWVYDNSLWADSPLASNPLLAALFGLDYIEPVEQWAPARLDYGLAAAQPERCAVMRDGIRTGAQYDGAARAVYAAFVPLLAEAMGASGEARRLDVREWREAVSRDGVWFEYTGSYPMELLAAWLSAGQGGGGEAGAMGLSFSDGGTDFLWREADGSLWSAAAAVSGHWPELPEMPPCAFAFEAEDADMLAEEQLLIDGPDGFETVLLTPPPDIRQDLTAYAPFMEALNIQPLGTGFYMRGETRVYIDVENERSCEVSPDGRILYSGAGADGDGTLAGAVLRAWEAVSLLSPAMGDAAFEVGRVSQTDDGFIVELTVAVNGIPLLWEPAVVTIRRNTVSGISLRLCRALNGTENLSPMPVRKAAALPPSGGRRVLELCYRDGGEGVASVVWAVRDR